jgi:hypothetical protein
MLNKQKNQNTDRHPHGKPENIDQNIKRIFPGIPKYNLEVVLEHGGGKVVRRKGFKVDSQHSLILMSNILSLKS